MITNHSYPSDKCTFELLSAYLDGEVTSKQRQQVQNLLATDPETQLLYKRLLNLRKGISNLPTPTSEYTPQQLSSAVFGEIDRRKKKRRIWLWGGGAIAAVVLTALGGIMNQNRTALLQIAQQKPSVSNNESLIIALNEPIIELPSESATESLAIPLDNSLMDIIGNHKE
jgi:anti-sigma factor RsiW